MEQLLSFLFAWISEIARQAQVMGAPFTLPTVTAPQTIDEFWRLIYDLIFWILTQGHVVLP